MIRLTAFATASVLTAFPVEGPDTSNNEKEFQSTEAAISLVSQSPSPLIRSPLAQADLYPEDYSFTVYRKGKKIGRHDVEFTRKGNALTVYNDLRLRVKFLFVTAYKLDYESTEIWQNGELTSVVAKVNDNGRKLDMGGGVTEASFGWQDIYGEQNMLPRGGEYFPTNHWFVSVLDETQLLNTLTGKLINVGITSEGYEEIETEDGPLLAERFRYSGDLNTLVWYDEKGRWVGLEFYGKDGSAIQYRCNGCVDFSNLPVEVGTAR